jgi:hypothetical protein
MHLYIAIAAALAASSCSNPAAAGAPTAVTVTSVGGIGAFVGAGPAPLVAVGQLAFRRVSDPTVVGPNETPFVLLDPCHGQQVTPVHVSFGGGATSSVSGGASIKEGVTVDIGAPAVLNALAKVQTAAGQNQQVIAQWQACSTTAAPAAPVAK